MFTSKTENVLTSLGFREVSQGVYLNESETKKIIMNGEGMSAYSVGRGFVDDEQDYLEMKLNFIPGDAENDYGLLESLLKRVFYL